MWIFQQMPKMSTRNTAIVAGIKILTRFLFVAVVATTCGSVFVTTKSLDGEKPVNVPTYESALPEAREICRQPVVQSKPDLIATHVVVVRQNGDTVRMDTTEAWARVKSPEDSDDVWVVGICAEDLVGHPTKPKSDIVDVTFE